MLYQLNYVPHFIFLLSIHIKKAGLIASVSYWCVILFTRWNCWKRLHITQEDQFSYSKFLDSHLFSEIWKMGKSRPNWESPKVWSDAKIPQEGVAWKCSVSVSVSVVPPWWDHMNQCSVAQKLRRWANLGVITTTVWLGGHGFESNSLHEEDSFFYPANKVQWFSQNGNVSNQVSTQQDHLQFVAHVIVVK